MDSDVLFPLDRYFNAVEIVWQDKETYIHTLSVLYAMLSDGSARVPFARIPKHDLVGRAVREAELATRTDRIERMWFNPCTCFRLLDRVHPFFAPR
jgi:hypothetical protein